MLSIYLQIKMWNVMKTIQLAVIRSVNNEYSYVSPTSISNCNRQYITLFVLKSGHLVLHTNHISLGTYAFIRKFAYTIHCFEFAECVQLQNEISEFMLYIISKCYVNGFPL